MAKSSKSFSGRPQVPPSSDSEAKIPGLSVPKKMVGNRAVAVKSKGGMKEKPAKMATKMPSGKGRRGGAYD